MKTIVKTTLYKGRKLVDIRKYFKKGDDLLPSRKGISITPDQALEISQAIKELQAQELKEDSQHYIIGKKYLLGSKVRVNEKNGEIELLVDPKVLELDNIAIIEAIVKGFKDFSLEEDLDLDVNEFLSTVSKRF